MPKLIANNNTPLSQLFEERILYEFFAFYPDNIVVPRDPVGIKNYWRLENVLYGKVDKTLTVIEPQKNILTIIKNQESNFYTFPEIASSFLDFQKAFKIPAQSGRLVEDNYLNAPEIFRAYIDGDDGYNDDITSMLENYNMKNLLLTPKTEEIKNIKDYAREFFNFILNSEGARKITKTAYILSSKTSALNSGLSIEIADLNPADNSDKQSFIQSINFNFYNQTAINNGFLIDKNIPWRLNFDLSSPANEDKISPGYVTRDIAASYLNKNFQSAYTDDLDYLISMVIVGYNSLVSKKKYYMEGSCKFFRDTVEKDQVLEDILPEYYWIKRYVQVRNKESGEIYTKPEVDKIIQYANDLNSGNIEYINSKFRLPYLFEGSTVYQNLKNYYLEKNNFSLDNFAEHVKIVIKNSINKIY